MLASVSNSAGIIVEPFMVFIVYLSEGVVNFACRELGELLEYTKKNSYYKIEVWNGSRKSGGHF
jgi:hypothetical protein